MYEYRCDERLKAEAEGSTDGCRCDFEATGVPSIFKFISKTAALVRMLTTFDLSSEENVSRRWWNWPLVDSGS